MSTVRTCGCSMICSTLARHLSPSPTSFLLTCRDFWFLIAVTRNWSIARVGTSSSLLLETMAIKDKGNETKTMLHNLKRLLLLTYIVLSSCFPPLGLDPKSIAINLSSIFLFLLPIFVYFYEKYWKEYIASVIGLFVLTYIIPPRGWLRPHEVSKLILRYLSTCSESIGSYRLFKTSSWTFYPLSSLSFLPQYSDFPGNRPYPRRN